MDLTNTGIFEFEMFFDLSICMITDYVWLTEKGIEDVKFDLPSRMAESSPRKLSPMSALPIKHTIFTSFYPVIVQYPAARQHPSPLSW